MPKYEPNLTTEQARLAARIKYLRMILKGEPIQVAAQKARVSVDTWLLLERWGLEPKNPEARRRIAEYLNIPEDILYDTSRDLYENPKFAETAPYEAVIGGIASEQSSPVNNTRESEPIRLDNPANQVVYQVRSDALRRKGGDSV